MVHCTAHVLVCCPLLCMYQIKTALSMNKCCFGNREGWFQVGAQYSVQWLLILKTGKLRMPDSREGLVSLGGGGLSHQNSEYAFSTQLVLWKGRSWTFRKSLDSSLQLWHPGSRPLRSNDLLKTRVLSGKRWEGVHTNLPKTLPKSHLAMFFWLFQKEHNPWGSIRGLWLAC